MFGKRAPRSSANLFSRPVSIIAHRGGAREAPENTLAAFRKAADSGYAIECDVRLSRDGHLVVFHDETLERTTDGQGRVADKSLEELRAFDAGDGERIPTLIEALEQIGGRVPLIIEVKCKVWGQEARRMARALVDDTSAMDASSLVVAASFNPIVLYHVGQMMSEVLRGLIFSNHSFFGPKLLLGKPDLLMPDHHLIDERFVDRMRSKGFRIFPWTVDDPGIARRLIGYGADGLITNRPTSLLST